MRKKQSSGLFFSPREIPVRVRGESFPTTTKSTCFLVRQVLFLLFCLFVSLCTGIEQPVRPRRSRRSRPGGTVLRTVPQGAGDSRTGHQKHLLSCKAGAFSFVLLFCKALYGNRTARPAAAKPAVPAGSNTAQLRLMGHFLLPYAGCRAGDRRLRRIVPPRSEKKTGGRHADLFQLFLKKCQKRTTDFCRTSVFILRFCQKNRQNHKFINLG